MLTTTLLSERFLPAENVTAFPNSLSAYASAPTLGMFA
jgi:hypothetical protein